ncbi:MAG TPA: hypothetical protein VGO58_05530 [Chitinophagaceae bacterium]|jgi:hypothetical protein|nr:hypothetical protein [Chitinophagaceae bacterium]
MKFLVFILFLASCSDNTSSAQQLTRKYFDSRDSTRGFYTVIEPKSGKPEILLVLLDGFGGNAEAFLTETPIDEKAYENNILTVCIPTGKRLYPDPTILQLITTTLKEVTTRYKITDDKIAMGGFSIGGTIVLRYAELSKEDPASYPFSPKAVFTGDSPIDLADLYRSSKRELEKNFPGPWLDEAKMIVDSLGHQFGDPDANKEAWQKINPFNTADTGTGNEQYIMDIAYRTYHDIDVQWQMENRGRSIYQSNALDGSELISRLRLRGNKKAAFIQSKIPGMRSNGQRHPHSWNIIDAAELIQWIRVSL